MYRVPARPPPRPPPPEVDPPLDLLDHVHRLMDRFPLGFAFGAAMLQLASGLLLAVVLARLL